MSKSESEELSSGGASGREGGRGRGKTLNVSQGWDGKCATQDEGRYTKMKQQAGSRPEEP